MDKKRKIIVGVSVAVGLVILGGGALGFHNYNVKAEEQEMALKQDQNKVKVLQEEINKCFTNSKKENIVASVKKEDVKELHEKIKKLPKNLDVAKERQTVITDVDDLIKMVYAREKVASLLDDQQVLVAGANIKLAQADVDRLKTKKPVFAEEQQKVIDEANNQQKVIDEATAKVNSLYTNDKKTEVKSDVTRDAYNSAKEAVNKIKQKQSKEALTKNLDTVNKYLNEKEAQKQAEAEKKAQNIASNDSETASSNEANESGSNASGNSGYSGKSSSGANSSSSGSSGGNQSSNGNGSSSKSSGGNNSTSKSSGGSSASKSSGGSSKSSGSSSSKSTGGNNSGSKSNSNGGNKSNYNYDKKSDTEKNVNGGTNDYWGW
ncbi:toxin Cry1Ac domain D-VI-related protein [Listeria monocytogenes]